MRINRYANQTNAIRDLENMGFTEDFKLEKNGMRCIQSGKIYKPSDMSIVEFHRFEGESNPDDMSVVFAVRCKDGIKGLIVSSFGIYADMDLVSFMDKVKILEHETTTAAESAGAVRPQGSR